MERSTEVTFHRGASPRPLLAQHSGLLEELSESTTRARALDIACGEGQNGIFAAKLGYSVTALDIADVAVDKTRILAGKEGVESKVSARQWDLTTQGLPDGTFDVIFNFYYLERCLFEKIKTHLRAGGLLFFETFHRGKLDEDPEFNPDYLLDKGELTDRFDDWERLHFERKQTVSQLVVRKPKP